MPTNDTPLSKFILSAIIVNSVECLTCPHISLSINMQLVIEYWNYILKFSYDFYL